MSSLVADYLVSPVLRQARRFSSGLSAEPEPSGVQPAVQSSWTNDEDVITESDEDVASPARARDSRQSNAAPARPEEVDLTHLRNLHVSAPAIPIIRADSDQSMSENIHNGDTDATAPDSATSGITMVPGNVLSGHSLEYERGVSPMEDDGMRALRQRIIAIQSRSIPTPEKARLMHQLLIEGYTRSQIVSQAKLVPQSQSPRNRSLAEPQAATTGKLYSLNKLLNHLGEGSTPLDLPLTEQDLRPTTYVPDSTSSDAGSDEIKSDDAPRLLGCQHYRRNVKMQCATCERWYTCRFCHDAVEDHVLPRKDTKNMLCMLCGCPQRVSDTCIRCGETAAHYYCGVCKLWNDDSNKSIYHCNDCGICRVGQGLGKDFFHCTKCMACISISISTTHKCIERATDCDCPICGDYMFSSPTQVVFMLCGHSIHRKCYEEHMKTSYKCPICNKSVVNMEIQFRNYDIAVASQPMPPEYADTRAIVSCNDCSAKSQTAYHWLGLKCTVCNSYNTVQLSILNPPIADLEDQDGIAVASTDTTVDQGPTPAAVSGLESFAAPEALAARDIPWPRNPSVHHRTASIGSREDMPSFSPFLAPGRLARSVSPLPVTGLGAAAASATPPPPAAAAAAVMGQPHGDSGEATECDDDDEDDLGFWAGGHLGHMVLKGGRGSEAAASDSDDDTSDSGDDDDADEDDEEEEEEAISLFGHR